MIKYIKNSDIKSKEFKRVQKDFLETARFHVHFYRQIQYSFCYQYSNLKGHEKILDAGCGHTAWPYFLETKYPSLDIHLLDKNDDALKKYPTRFKTFSERMENTSFPDKYFDVIYSISTLEHTDKWRETILEFNRLINNSGKLVLNIDVSPNYFLEENIPELLNLLKQRFEVTEIDLDSKDSWVMLIQKNLEVMSLTCVLKVK